MLEKFHTYPSPATDEEIAYTLKQLTYARIDNWLDTDFLTWRWGLQVGLALISLFLFWKLVDKKRLMEMTFHSLLVMTIAIWSDQVGYEFGLWYYPVDLIPIFPPATAIDYIMLPIIYTLIYQYFQRWKSFLIATFIMAGIFTIILEPALVKLGLYVPIKWYFHYGFPIYIIIGIVVKLITEKIATIVAMHQPHR